MLFATTVDFGLLDRYQLVGDRKIPRRVRQDAAVQLSVRHRADADARRHRRHSLSRQAHFSGGADADLGAIGFATAALLYGSRGPDAGVLQFVLYGLVGLVPAMLSSWLAHRYDDDQRRCIRRNGCPDP
jgi:hypothetical protein